MTPNPPADRRNWLNAWPDALAFALGLGLAWWNVWTTKDLVWSLWLSSLLIGYSIIVVSIFRPAVRMGLDAARGSVAGAAVFDSVVLVGALLMLAFFTVHFGMFHFVHSIFLNSFFPVLTGPPPRGFNMMPVYTEVFRRYWPFLIAAAMAERRAFFGSAQQQGDATDVISKLKTPQTNLGEPYKNVARMHLLIFFFAFAHFAHLENFAVYAVVYAVYFFPWRLIRPAKPTAPAA